MREKLRTAYGLPVFPRWLPLALLAGFASACVTPGRVMKPDLSKIKLAKGDMRDALNESDSAVLSGDIGAPGRLRSVGFAYDSYALTREARAVLAANAELLREADWAEVVVEGHCDELGTSAYNLALGERRAAAVREYYRVAGIPESRLRTLSYGEEKPICVDASDTCRDLNRRAKTVIKAAR